MILACTCKNAYQDKKYGKGKRVHNLYGKGQRGESARYRCAVCNTERGK